jgi:hypothetical protein
MQDFLRIVPGLDVTAPEPATTGRKKKIAEPAA